MSLLSRVNMLKYDRIRNYWSFEHDKHCNSRLRNSRKRRLQRAFGLRQSPFERRFRKAHFRSALLPRRGAAEAHMFVGLAIVLMILGLSLLTEGLQQRRRA